MSVDPFETVDEFAQRHGLLNGNGNGSAGAAVADRPSAGALNSVNARLAAVERMATAQITAPDAEGRVEMLEELLAARGIDLASNIRRADKDRLAAELGVTENGLRTLLERLRARKGVVLTGQWEPTAPKDPAPKPTTDQRALWEQVGALAEEWGLDLTQETPREAVLQLGEALDASADQVRRALSKWREHHGLSVVKRRRGKPEWLRPQAAARSLEPATAEAVPLAGSDLPQEALGLALAVARDLHALAAGADRELLLRAASLLESVMGGRQ